MNSLHINHVTNAIRAGHLDLGSSKKLIFVPDPARSLAELKNEAGRVYFLCVDGIIVKIGGSQCKGGIQGTIGWYLNGWAKGNSERTYCVWHYMHQALTQGKSVEFYFISAKIITEVIPTMNSFVTQQIPIDFHQIEKACVDEYATLTGSHPVLNMQEGAKKWSDAVGPTGKKLLEGYINKDGTVYGSNS